MPPWTQFQPPQQQPDDQPVKSQDASMMNGSKNSGLTLPFVLNLMQATRNLMCSVGSMALDLPSGLATGVETVSDILSVDVVKD